jgi:ATP-dependent DNA ligase
MWLCSSSTSIIEDRDPSTHLNILTTRDHVASGTELFQVICERDMEGVVAKQATAKYTPDATTWVKIKNRQYSQAVGREDFFGPPKAPG